MWTPPHGTSIGSPRAPRSLAALLERLAEQCGAHGPRRPRARGVGERPQQRLVHQVHRRHPAKHEVLAQMDAEYTAGEVEVDEVMQGGPDRVDPLVAVRGEQPVEHGHRRGPDAPNLVRVRKQHAPAKGLCAEASLASIWRAARSSGRRSRRPRQALGDPRRPVPGLVEVREVVRELGTDRRMVGRHEEPVTGRPGSAGACREGGVRPNRPSSSCPSRGSAASARDRGAARARRRRTPPRPSTSRRRGSGRASRSPRRPARSRRPRGRARARRKACMSRAVSWSSSRSDSGRPLAPGSASESSGPRCVRRTRKITGPAPLRRISCVSTSRSRHAPSRR